MKDFLRIADLTPVDLHSLLDLADYCEVHPHGYDSLLRDETVVCYFAKPSTRTRLSFASAIAHLGGTAEIVGPGELQLGRGETIEDTAHVISRYAKAFVIRTFADEDVIRFARAASIPVINALTDLHHPCQALADLLTLRQRFQTLHGLKLAYLGDGNNVAHSLLEACALAGVNIAVATPRGYEPDAAVVQVARELAERSSASVAIGNDPVAAVTGADAVYADAWVSMGDPEAERSERRRVLEPFQVNDHIMSAATDHAIFMHCLPAHRGDEVSAPVIDGRRSVIFDQAAHRMHTSQALLIALLTNHLQGASQLDASAR
jgi:ornithine carbamoyltransferase